MSYTPTTWATGDVITADKLNNMESGIVTGQNDVEFVKLATFTMWAQSESFGCNTGGLLPDGKTIGDLIGNKTVIGLTSTYRYSTSSENENYNIPAVPVNTYLSDMGHPISLWDFPSHMTDTSISVSILWGMPFPTYGQVTNFKGEIDIYAICI